MIKETYEYVYGEVYTSNKMILYHIHMNIHTPAYLHLFSLLSGLADYMT